MSRLSRALELADQGHHHVTEAIDLIIGSWAENAEGKPESTQLLDALAHLKQVKHMLKGLEEAVKNETAAQATKAVSS